MNRSQSWILAALGAAALAFAMLNAALLVNNRADRQEIDQRAWFVKQTAEFRAMYVEMVDVTTKMSEQLGDPVLRKMLVNVGLGSAGDVRPAPPAATPGPQPAAPAPQAPEPRSDAAGPARN